MPGRDDFSDQVFAIQITLGAGVTPDAPVIAQVLVGRRPPGLYGGRDRSHLTAWRTFVDGIRLLIFGRTLPDALQRVLALSDRTGNLLSHQFSGQLRDVSMRDLPADSETTMADEGGSLAATQEMPASSAAASPAVKKAGVAGATGGADSGAPEDEAQDEDEAYVPTGTPRFWYAAAGRHRVLAAAAARAYLQGARGTADTELELLQNLVAGYLHYRNTVPLAAVREPFPLGGADKAAKEVLAVELSRAQGQLSPGTRVGLAASLWELLDFGVLATVLTKDGKAFVFGNDADQVEDGKLVASALVDHIVTMESSYPRACFKCRFRIQQPHFHNLPEKVKQRAGSIENYLLNSDDLPEHIPDQFEVPARPDDTRPAPPEPTEFERFAVQVDRAADGTISHLYIGGRPKAGPGRHATAWVVLCDYVRACLVGQPLAQVPEILRVEKGQIQKLREETGVTVKSPAPPGPAASVELAAAQVMIAGFLTLLNNTEGAIIETGGTSPGNTEPILREKIRGRTGTLADVIGLFDSACINALLNKWTEGSSFTGELEDTSPVIALRLAMHLYIAKKAYQGMLSPDVTAKLQSEDALASLLLPTGMNLDTAKGINKTVTAALGRPAYNHDSFVKAYKELAAVARPRGPSRKPGSSDFQMPQESDDSQ